MSTNKRLPIPEQIRSSIDLRKLGQSIQSGGSPLYNPTGNTGARCSIRIRENCLGPEPLVGGTASHAGGWIGGGFFSSTFDITLTKPAMNDRIVIVGFMAPGGPISCTLNGVAGTLLHTYHVGGSDQQAIYYFLDAVLPPAAGTYSIVTRWTNDSQYENNLAVEIYAANQINPFGTVVDNANLTLIVPSGIGNFILDYIHVYEGDVYPGPAFTLTPVETLVVRQYPLFYYHTLGMSCRIATTNSDDMEWTASRPPSGIFHIGIPIRPAAVIGDVLSTLVVPCGSIVSSIGGVVEIQYTGGGACTPDASVVTYNPADDTDWDGDADPGNADDAFDQLAERVDDLEGGSFATITHIDQSGGTLDTYGVLGGLLNGANVNYTVEEGIYATGTLLVYLNGQLLTQGSAEGWQEDDPAAGTFILSVAPEAIDDLLVVYDILADLETQIDQLGGTADTYGVLAATGDPTIFTVSQGVYLTGTLTVYLNGQLLIQGTAEDWVEDDPSTGTFQFLVAPSADDITVVYKYAGGGGGPCTPDASVITYAPDVLTDWDGDADPGNADDAFDQLAERVDDLEGAGCAPDASVVTYTPAVAADWDGNADPGNTDDAIDQLAERVDDLEGAPPGGVTRNGNTTDHHLAVWNGNNADSIEDGGAVPAGGGDVVGPAGAVGGNMAVFDGGTGKLIADGGPVPAGGGSPAMKVYLVTNFG